MTAEDVTIDLNGFKIAGIVGCTGFGATLNCTPVGSGVGIDGSSTRGTTVRNGIVRGFGSHGVYLGNDARVEDVSSFTNAANGIWIGDGGFVLGCHAFKNGAIGIVGGTAGIIEHNQVQHNRTDGIQLTGSGRISGNIVRNSGDDGIQAYSSLVENNVVLEVSDEGIFIPVGGEGGLVRGNSVRDNVSIGINANTRTGYSHNSLYGNGTATNGGVNMGANNCSGSLCP